MAKIKELAGAFGWGGAFLSLIPILFVVFLFLVKVSWGWVIPDLFPGAVEQGLVAGSISLGTAG